MVAKLSLAGKCVPKCNLGTSQSRIPLIRDVRDTMVQLKYFGDSRDFFKYDLITAVFKHSSLRHYVFVPMLTEHRDDNEGNKTPINRGDKSDDLLKFIIRCNTKSLRHWEGWLNRHVDSYRTVEPVDETFFSDQKRDVYWKAFRTIIGQKNALIFVDPDTGLETGKPSYLRRMGREKYILTDELKFLINKIHHSSVLMLYQHLPNDKRMHKESVEKKLEQVRCADCNAYTCAYREDDLAFLFVSREKALIKEIIGLLTNYHVASDHKYKSLHS